VAGDSHHGRCCDRHELFSDDTVLIAYRQIVDILILLSDDTSLAFMLLTDFYELISEMVQVFI
jgi:hypothetical protein